MFRAFSNRLRKLLSRGAEKNWPVISVVLITVVFTIALVAALSLVRTHRDLTAFALSRRQAIAYLTAATIKEKLDRLTDIGVSLATRVRFGQLIRQGKWEEAVEILHSVPKDFPFIERIFLTDPHGTLMADTPELPGVRGRNFAYRDWYLGVSRKWEPYVSEVYNRAAEPRYNVIAVAVPIKGEKTPAAGVLVLQVRIDTLLEWTREIDVGPSEFVFVVDRLGKVAAHPELTLQGEIPDFSNVPWVQKALRGERGVEILLGPSEKEKLVLAYVPVPAYGWGVIAQQPTRAAFASRNGTLKRLALAYGLIILASCALAYVIVRFVRERRRSENEIKQLNEELRQGSAELEAANKELEAFSYSVSHDLRAPLRAVDGFSRILLEKHLAQLPADAQGYLHRVRDNAQQMGRLIDDLLTFSRLGRAPLKKVEVWPADLARQVIEELHPDKDNRRLEITIGDLPPSHADPALLKQVFVNLLSNALKYTRDREVAQIEVGWQRKDARAVFYVKDNGVGFDMDYAGKLFGVFQRLHRTEDYEGTGVGLAIVHRIITRHGGRVWAEAELDKGATFYFTLGGR